MRSSPAFGVAELTKVRTYCDTLGDCAGQPNLVPLCRFNELLCNPDHTPTNSSER